MFDMNNTGIGRIAPGDTDEFIEITGDLNNTYKNNISKILRVDKVVFDNNDIWIIDYKTDKATDKMPLSYKKQLYKYKDALTQIYPNKKIHTAILWINDLKFDEII